MPTKEYTKHFSKGVSMNTDEYEPYNKYGSWLYDQWMPYDDMEEA